jgi:hypothetical protein
MEMLHAHVGDTKNVYFCKYTENNDFIKSATNMHHGTQVLFEVDIFLNL